jgi:hypothetical protein
MRTETPRVYWKDPARIVIDTLIFGKAVIGCNSIVEQNRTLATSNTQSGITSRALSFS